MYAYLVNEMIVYTLFMHNFFSILSVNVTEHFKFNFCPKNGVKI